MRWWSKASDTNARLRLLTLSDGAGYTIPDHHRVSIQECHGQEATAWRVAARSKLARRLADSTFACVFLPTAWSGNTPVDFFNRGLEGLFLSGKPFRRENQVARSLLVGLKVLWQRVVESKDSLPTPVVVAGIVRNDDCPPAVMRHLVVNEGTREAAHINKLALWPRLQLVFLIGSTFQASYFALLDRLSRRETETDMLNQKPIRHQGKVG
jgi:hypothetical protein